MSTKDVRGRRTSEDDRRALAELLHHRPAPLAAPPQILEKPGLFDDVAEPHRASSPHPTPVEVTEQRRPEARFTPVAPPAKPANRPAASARRTEAAAQHTLRGQPQSQATQAKPTRSQLHVDTAPRAGQRPNPEERSVPRSNRSNTTGSSHTQKTQGDRPMPSQRGAFRTGDDDEPLARPVVPPAVQSAEDLREAGWWDTLMNPSRDWIDEPRKRNILVLVIALVSMLVILWTYMPRGSLINGLMSMRSPAGQVGNAHLVPDGEHSLVGAPTIDAARIDQVLRSYNSPAAGTGAIWIEMGQKYGLDPAYAVAFFIQESTAGTHPNWAGLKPDGTTTHNIGNIICAGYQTCYQGHRDYPSWAAGIEDWNRLITREYVEGRGIATLEEILPIYCPVGDGCRPDHYVEVVKKLVSDWR